MSGRRRERMEEGAEDNSLRYGAMGSFAKDLNKALKTLKLDMNPRDWGHQGKGHQKKKP